MCGPLRCCALCRSRLRAGSIGAARGGLRRVCTALLACGVAGLVAACGADDDGRSHEAAYRRIRFSSGAEPAGATTVLARVAAAPGAKWTATGATRTAVREVEGQLVFIAERTGEEPLSIRIPVPEAAVGFDRVVVEIASAPVGGFNEVRVAPYAADEGLAPPGEAVLRTGASTTPIALTFPRLPERSPAPVELHITFDPPSRLALVRAVTFAVGSIEADLVLSEDDDLWPMADVGEVRMRASHVTSGAPSRGHFALERGEAVEIFLAPDPTYARAGEVLTFQVELGIGDARSAKTVEASAGRWTPLRWEAGVLPAGDAELVVNVRSSRPEGAAVGWIGGGAVRRTVADAPTVILITSDTHRADHLSIIDGGSLVRTPHLDRLARTGVLFTDCYAQTNVTNPSHVSLMTALHPKRTRIVDNRTRLARHASTLAERFAASGYETLAVTSAFHLLDEHSGLGQGFDRMTGPREAQRDGEESIHELVEWLGARDGSPVFAWLHLFDAHTPYGPPEPYDRRYYPKDKDPFSGPVPASLQGLDEGRFPPELRGLKDLNYPHAQYRAEVDYLDGALGELFELPRLDRAIIAFTADHGESFGQHGVWWDHAGLYPETVHIPLILRWPGCEAGRVVAAPVRQSDVGPTLMAIAGVEAEGIEGTDLRAVAAAEARVDARFLLSSYDTTAAVRLDRWLLVLELRQGSAGPEREPGQVELFDVTADPGCTRDVLLEHLAVAKDLRALLIDWLGRPGGPPLGERSNRTPRAEAMLRGLGYTDDGGSASGELWDPAGNCPGDWQRSPWRRLFEDPAYLPDDFRADLARWRSALAGGR